MPKKKASNKEADDVMMLDPFTGVFGMPPQSHVSDSAIINSMPYLKILPGLANFESGLTLFRVNTDEGWKKYISLLKKHGFGLTTPSVNLAFIADNFPTDSFTNEYGETFLQKFTDVASQGMQQLAQMTNSGTGLEAGDKLATGMKTAFKDVEGGLGSAVRGAADAAKRAADALQQMKTNIGNSSEFLGGALDTVDKMLAGSRVDFPNIWRNSGFTPNYTATVRLYNPNPGSEIATKRHIIGPLAVILCLMVPQSEDGKTFKWPFFLSVNAPGIYKLDPAVITNVTIVKGGDQQQIAFTKRLAMVDVRIDFTSLYSTMVVESDVNYQSDRPTLRNYLDSLKLQEVDQERIYTRKQMRESARKASGIGEDGPEIKIVGIPPIGDPSAKNSVELDLAKTAAARRRQAPTVSEKEVDSRVPGQAVNTQASLTSQSNPDFITSA